jgi:phosphopentomutase
MGRGARVAAALTGFAGIGRLTTVGGAAHQTVRAAREMFERLPEGMMFVYLPDCDRAGHAHGWMSPPYLQAAAEIDIAIGAFATGLRDATLIVLADHGGGGIRPRDHDLPHPLNDRIPLVIAGRGVRHREVLPGPVSLLDVPATILWHLGIPVPDCYEGRPLREAFLHRSLSAEEAAA